MLHVSVARVSYELYDDPKKERLPTLFYWLSQDVSLQPKELALSSSYRGAIEPFQFSVPVLQDAGDGIPAVERIQRANLNLDVFSRLYNKHGLSVRNQAGSVRVPVYELLALAGSANAAGYELSIGSWGDPNARGENRDPEVDNIKGRIEFAGPVTLTYNGAQVPPLSAQDMLVVRDVRQRQEAVFRHYMGSTVVFCRKLGYRWGVIKDINAYVYQCRAGILPASAYLGTRLGGTGAEYFLAAARTVLSRHRIDPLSFDFERDPRGARVLGQVLTLMSNYMAYVPDIVYLPSRANRRKFLRKMLESFDLARFKGGGDCEDLALEILLEAAELKELSEQQLPPLVASMQRLCRRYVFTMALGGVSSAEINGDYGTCKEMGAHMWSCMIPVELWRHWWRRGNLADDERVIFGGAPLQLAGRTPLILEGTGFLRPDAVAEAESPQVKLVECYQKLLEASSPAGFSGMRKVFHYRRGRRSSFYQTFSIFFTNHFLRHDSPKKHIAFAVCSHHPQVCPKPAIGVEFDVVASGNTEVPALWAEPAVNQVESACIRDALKDLYPTPPLAPAHLAPAEVREVALIEKLRQESSPVAPVRDSLYSSDSIANGPLCEVEFYLSSPLVEEARIAAIIAAAKGDLSPFLVGVDCYREAVSASFCGWRIVFRCRVMPEESLISAIKHLKSKHRGDNDDQEDADDTY